MGTLNEAVKRLENWSSFYDENKGPWGDRLAVSYEGAPLNHSDIRLVLDALSEAREVLAGADHTAAKYWRRMTEAERERDEAREARFLEREESNITCQQRDELAAVIERARRRPPERTATTDSVYDILAAVPADVLRERDAERWDEGFAEGQLDGSIGHAEPNPYRETKEQD